MGERDPTNLTEPRLAGGEARHRQGLRVRLFASLGRRRQHAGEWAGIIATVFSAAAIAATWSVAATAQELYVYPQKGQSTELQRRDRFECHEWAVAQTGVDPTRQQSGTAAPAYAPAPPQPEAPQGGVVRGAARGAVVGVVGGAIAGDAGKGAAIGAGTGALIGGMRRRDQQAREQQAQQNYERQRAAALEAQKAESAGRHSAYNRAITACLQARGYSVN